MAKNEKKEEPGKKSNFRALLEGDDDYSNVTKSKSNKPETPKGEEPIDDSSEEGDDIEKTEGSDNKGGNEGLKTDSAQKTQSRKSTKKSAPKKKPKEEHIASGDEMKLLFEHGNEMEYGAHLDVDNDLLKKLIGTRWPKEIVASDVITMRVGRKNNKWIKVLADEFEISDTQVLANILAMFRIRYKDFIEEVLESRSRIEL